VKLITHLYLALKLRINGVMSIPLSISMVCLIDYILCPDVGFFKKIEIKQDRLSPTETVDEALKKITQRHKSEERNCASQSIKHACLINNNRKGKRRWKKK